MEEKAIMNGALLDIEIWQEIVRFLQELEEQNMVRSYMSRRQLASSPEQMGLLSWEAAQRELDALEEADNAASTGRLVGFRGELNNIRMSNVML